MLLVDLDGSESFGIEAAEACGVPVLCLVGADADPVTESLLERERLEAPLGFVVKPVDVRQLRLSIETVLYARARADRAAAGSRRPVAELDRRPGPRI